MSRIDRQDVLEAVYAAVDELNEQLPRDERIEKSEEMRLFGNGGQLDSLGVITLVVLTEEQVRRVLNREVSLGEHLESDGENPFATIGTLTDLLARELRA